MSKQSRSRSRSRDRDRAELVSAFRQGKSRLPPEIKVSQQRGPPNVIMIQPNQQYQGNEYYSVSKKEKNRQNTTEASNAFFHACSEGDLEEAIRLLEEDESPSLIDINKQDKSSNTALINASYYGFTDIVKLLIQNGADLNFKNDSGDTALILAISSGFVEIAELLINSGAKLDLQNDRKETALTFAISSGFVEIAKLLIIRGADPNISFPLALAIHSKHPDIAEMLISVEGIDLNAKLPLGGTALHLACKKNYLYICEQLLANGANINIRDKFGETPLSVAVRLEREGIAKLLQENNAKLGGKRRKTTKRKKTKRRTIKRLY